jgi:hypothetical protein
MKKHRKMQALSFDKWNQEKPEKEMKNNQKKKPANKWTESEYSTLINMVRQIGEDWSKIALKLDNKTAKQCMQKFKNSQRSAKKGNWTLQEDELLFSWVKRFGPTKWTECSKEIKGRCGKQCRERWVNILNPEVKKGNWTEYEQDVIFNNLSTYNTSWSAMSHILPGRTENSIKNYFYSSVRRLRSNNLINLFRSIYVYKKTSPQQILESSQSIQYDIAKLNRLSQKICNFLIDRNDRNDTFLHFLLSVIFGSEVSATCIGNETKKNDGSTGFVPLPQKNLYVPCDKLDTSVPNRSLNQIDPKVVLEAMRLLASNPEFVKIAPFLKIVESELPNSQIVQSGKKTEIRMTTCWNCKTDMCPKHAATDLAK